MNARILIVEDEGLIALHIEEMLNHAGFEVPDLFSCGEDIIAYLATSPPPDIILMDIGLAGPMNGIQAARCIRKKADIPVIFLTAYNDPRHLCEAAEVSPYGYLTKPFTAKDLVATLEAALVRSGSPHGGGE
jgi:DNA-binding response OmpR family regulator